MKWIAHRGFSKQAPENTYQSVAFALDSTCEGIEIDVHLTKDGKIVVHHDFVLGRTSNGVGKISEKTMNELKELDFTSWHPGCKQAHGIATLEEILSLVDGKKDLVIEIKGYGDPQVFIKELFRNLEGYPKEKIWIKSFDHRLIAKIKEEDSSYQVGPLWSARVLHPGYYLLENDFEFASIAGTYVDASFVKEMKQVNKEWMVWTCNHKEEFQMLKMLSDDVWVITDDKELMDQYKKNL